MTQSNKILNKSELVAIHDFMRRVVEAGLPLPEGIRKFSGGIENARVRDKVDAIGGLVEDGKPLSEAMAGVLPHSYLALIEVGEKGGNLVEALDLALDNELFHRSLLARLRAVVAYPLLVFVVVTVTYFLAAIFVFPTIYRIFEGMGRQAPAVALYATHIMDYALINRYLVLPIIIAVVVFLFTPYARRLADRVILAVPVLKQAAWSRFLSSFARSMSILLRGGLTTSEAFESAVGLISNSAIHARLVGRTGPVREGHSLKEALSGISGIPESFLFAVATAEQAGALPQSLLSMSELYRTDSEKRAAGFLRWLDAGLLLLLGAFVAWMTVSLFGTYVTMVQMIDRTVMW